MRDFYFGFWWLQLPSWARPVFDNHRNWWQKSLLKKRGNFRLADFSPREVSAEFRNQYTQRKILKMFNGSRDVTGFSDLQKSIPRSFIRTRVIKIYTYTRGRVCDFSPLNRCGGGGVGVGKRPASAGVQVVAAAVGTAKQQPVCRSWCRSAGQSRHATRVHVSSSPNNTPAVHADGS